MHRCWSSHLGDGGAGRLARVPVGAAHALLEQRHLCSNPANTAIGAHYIMLQTKVSLFGSSCIALITLRVDPTNLL